MEWPDKARTWTIAEKISALTGRECRKPAVFPIKCRGPEVALQVK